LLAGFSDLASGFPPPFFGGSKIWSEVSVKLQYIVLTLLLPTIYCFGTLVVCSGLGDEEMFG
jgi:hypothetical protein